MTKKENTPRIFPCTRDDKTIIQLSVRLPEKAEIEAADMEYSAQFNKAICHGLPTQTALLRRLREAGQITTEIESEIGQLVTDLRAIAKNIQASKYAVGEELDKKKADQVTKNKRLTDLNRDVESFFEHTADMKSAQSQRNFLVACVCYYVDGPKKGDRVWESVDELMSEDDSALMSRVIYEYVTLSNGEESDWNNLMKKNQAEGDKKDDNEVKGEQAVILAAATTVPEVTLMVDTQPVVTEASSQHETAPAPPAEEQQDID